MNLTWVISPFGWIFGQIHYKAIVPVLPAAKLEQRRYKITHEKGAVDKMLSHFITAPFYPFFIYILLLFCVLHATF
jgi:hypothetical protein